MTQNKLIIVGMADLNACKSPGGLTTLGLGSCVGICLYDPMAKVAGMAHCMLPDSTQIPNQSSVPKYVDTAVVKLLNDMARLGARKERLQAKIAGAAQMFAFNSTNEKMRIGDRNIEATVKVLAYFRIPIVARDVGLNYGRTIELYAETGQLIVKTIGHGNKVL